MVLRPAALGLLGGAHELLDGALVVAGVAPVAREAPIASLDTPVELSKNSATSACRRARSARGRRS